ncbi:family 11 glycosyl hydrolase [Xylariaceae sp. FL0594]|nr:family 11 glycosyl hydrolase [Xylariaceae sp. FL0594]
MAGRLAAIITALAAISGSAIAAPRLVAGQQGEMILPDLHLGSGDLARRQEKDYTYNWTGIDNQLDFKPSASGYSVTFDYRAGSDPNTVGNFAVGRGWSEGTNRTITFQGSTNVSSTSGVTTVSVYGWMTSPRVEYWIVEYSNRPEWLASSAATRVGTVESDGAVYDVYRYALVPLPDLGGEVTWQYHSVRRAASMRPGGGTVTTANHFNAWKALGLKLGSSMGFQILATEGYKAVGSSQYTVDGY